MPVMEYHLAWWRRWLRRPFIRVVLRLLFYILAPVKITGQKKCPIAHGVHCGHQPCLPFRSPVCGRILAGTIGGHWGIGCLG